MNNKIIKLVLFTLFFIPVFLYSETYQYKEQCDKEISKENIDKKLIFNYCGKVAKEYEKNKNFGRASFYYLFSNEENIINTLEKHISSTSTILDVHLGHLYTLNNKLRDASKLYKSFLNKYNNPNKGVHDDFKLLFKLYPTKKIQLEKSLKIWDDLYKPLLPIDKLYVKYKREQKVKNYTKAIEYQKEIVNIKKEYLNNHSIVVQDELLTLAILYKNIANTHYLNKKYSKSEMYYVDSLEIYEKLSSKKMTADLLNKTLEVFSKLDDIYEKAKLSKKIVKNKIKSLNLVQKYYGEKHDLSAAHYFSLALALISTDIHNPKIIKYLNGSLAIFEVKYGASDIKTNQVLSTFAAMFYKRNDYENSIKYIKKVLLNLRKDSEKNKLYISNNLFYLCGIYRNQNKISKAISTCEESIEILDNNQKLTLRSRSYLNLSYLYAYEKNYLKAIEYGNLALAFNSNNSNGHDNSIQIQSLLAIYYLKNKDFKNAYVHAVEYLKKSLLNKEENLKLRSDVAKHSYMKEILLPIKGFFNIASFYIRDLRKKNNSIEAKKVRRETFTYWLNYKGSISENGNLLRAIQDTSKSKEVKEKINQYFVLKKKIGFIYGSLSNITNQKEIDLSLLTITSYKKDISDIEVYLSTSVAKYKDYQQLKTVDYKQISAILKDDELYIDYAKTENNYYVFTLDNKNKISFNKLALSKDIEKSIDIFSKNISSITPSEYPVFKSKEDIKYKDISKQKLFDIYKLVINPIKDKIASKNKLIISQDSKLNLIPFEILFDNKDISKGKYLLEHKTIKYTPSGKSLLQLYMININKQTTKNKVELFYAPSFGMEMDDKKQAFLETLPRYDRSSSRSGEWKDLLGTEKEGKEIVSIYQKGNEYEIIENQKLNANIENLLKVKQPTILHIATHGYYKNDPDITNPLLKSGIVLAGANKNSSYGEISALKLSSLDLKGTQLVVLSACETGVGEGFSGLNKVFIQAGAKAIISSLWKVPDVQTKDLMVNMHKNIKEGKSAYIALEEAKKKFIKDDIHPYFWAAFIYNGL